MIGQGSFGTVISAEQREGHPNVVHLKGAYTDGEERTMAAVYFVFEHLCKDSVLHIP
eukprot:gene25080-30600_t